MASRQAAQLRTSGELKDRVRERYPACSRCTERKPLRAYGPVQHGSVCSAALETDVGAGTALRATIIDVWLPASADELAGALAARSVQESHSVDFKREFAPGNAANSGMAVDLACFAVDGGVIYVGVDEDPSPPALAPFPLSGLVERIEQIARSGVIDPPLDVVIKELETGPGVGAVMIVIPPSPFAPHQVDGKYRGRGGVTNSVLSDGEVRRVIDSRRQGRERGRAGLDELVASDPLSGQLEQQIPRLFVSARPGVHQAGRLLDALPSGNIEHWIRGTLLSNNGPLIRELRPRFGMDFIGGMNINRRADGWGVAIGTAGQPMGSGTAAFIGKGALDLEISEDGDVALYCCDISDMQAQVAVWDETVNGLVMRAVLVAGAVSTAVGYLGEWDIGVELADVKRSVSGSEKARYNQFLVSYSDERYRRLITTSAITLTSDPPRIVDMLMGAFNRAMSGGRVAIPSAP